jgi:hypothetical protein
MEIAHSRPAEGPLFRIIGHYFFAPVCALKPLPIGTYQPS